MSATFHQLSNPMYVTVVSKDNAFGRAFAWLCHGPDVSVIWGVILDNKEIWWVKNESIRAADNFSLDYSEYDSGIPPPVIRVPLGVEIENLPKGIKVEHY